MNLPEYRQAVFIGFQSILGAARDWRCNPLTTEVNRRLWGPWPWAALSLLTAAGLGLYVVMPSFETLIGFLPPLTALAFIPKTVRGLVYSVPGSSSGECTSGSASRRPGW